jgi:hypothetical protein
MAYNVLNPIMSAYMGGGVKVYTDLDPIDPETVGRANVPAMLTWATQHKLSIFVMLFTITISGATWMETIYDPKPAFIDVRYLAHLQQLSKVGLVLDQDQLHATGRTKRWIKHWSRYFAVEKTTTTSRSIFNGNRLSEKCKSPPNVNLLTQPEILALMQRMLETGSKLYFIEADLRHWFHQIKVCEHLQKFFGLIFKINNRLLWFVWRCLPMGWSWSPAIAQACGWTCLLFTRRGQDQLFDFDTLKRDPNSLPRWVNSKSGKSFAVVYYDNLLVVSTDSDETDVIEKRLRTNIAATALNVEIKGQLNRSIDQVTYLGMQVVIARSEGKPVLQVHPSKLEKWGQTTLKDEDTCRTYASFVGRVLFFASLEHPNLRLSTIGKAGLQMAQQVGVLAHREGWDHRMKKPDGLTNAWSRVMSSAENPVLVRCREEGARHATTVLATDASSEGWGIVVFDESGTHMKSSDGDTWREEDKRWLLRSSADEHIFYKELRAVLYGLSRLPDDASAIVVVDNAAVAWVLRNGFSRTLLGNALLKSSEHLLHKIHDVVLVVSHDNPADSPSRGTDVEADRVERMAIAIELHYKGVRWASRRDTNMPWSSHRHVEPDVPDAIGPDDECDEAQEPDSQSATFV